MTIGKTYVGVLQKYAVFSGRATRSEFWPFILIIFLVQGSDQDNKYGPIPDTQTGA